MQKGNNPVVSECEPKGRQVANALKYCDFYKENNGQITLHELKPIK